ncbi:hypothetical protein D3C72_1535910 [compost metagenome]
MERRQQRRQHQTGRLPGNIEPQGPRWCATQLAYLAQRALDILQRGGEPLQQQLARFRWRHAARRSVEQARVQHFFDLPKAVAEGRRRHPQLTGRLAEAAQLGHPHEGGKGVEAGFARFREIFHL